MFTDIFTSSIDTGRRPRRSARSRWRALTALVAAFALVFVLMLAASHHHRDGVEADSCTVCGVSLLQFSGVPDAVLAAPPLVLLPYRLATTVIYRCLYGRVRVLPPSCGPPAAPR